MSDNSGLILVIGLVLAVAIGGAVALAFGSKGSNKTDGSDGSGDSGDSEGSEGSSPSSHPCAGIVEDPETYEAVILNGNLYCIRLDHIE